LTRRKSLVGFRRSEVTPHKNEHKLIETANISKMLASLIGKKLATLHELQTVYSMKDAYNLYEVVTVDSYNAHVLSS